MHVNRDKMHAEIEGSSFFRTEVCLLPSLKLECHMKILTASVPQMTLFSHMDVFGCK